MHDLKGSSACLAAASITALSLELEKNARERVLDGRLILTQPEFEFLRLSEVRQSRVERTIG